MTRWIFVALLSLAHAPVAVAAGCHSSCRELARSCKVQCSSRFAFGLARHDCKRRCEAREHSCHYGC